MFRQRFKSTIGRLLVLSCLLVVVGCHPNERARPIGYFRVGKLSSLAAPEIYDRDAGLLIRRDQNGLYAMSTLCTYDLSPLNIVNTAEGRILASPETTSKYSMNGDVLSGPAVEPLPYFELVLDRGEIDGPIDTVYAQIGRAISRDWRLKIP